MDTIKMIYIDDSPDISLSKYLDKFRSDLCQFDYSDIEFNSEEGYESLINNTEVRTANIIFIDSKLFENRNTNGKFTGEEFRQIFSLYLLVSLAWQTLHNFHWSNKFLCYFSSVYLILCFCNPIFSLLFEGKNIQAFLSLTFSLQQWQHLLQSEFLVLRFFYSFGYQPFYYDLKIVCIKKVVLFFRYIW